MKDLLRFNVLLFPPFDFAQDRLRRESLKFLLFKITLLLSFVIVSSCKNDETDAIKNRNVGNALGTTYAITFIADKELDFQKEFDSVFQAVNQSMSTYIPDSDISKINQGDSTLVVDAMFREVFELSKSIYSDTDGYFDPTVGVLVDAWGFGPGAQIEMDSTKVDSLNQYVGWNKVKLLDDGTVQKAHSEIRFDFNAIAKGYAIDRLGKMLSENGIKNYLIEVGGEVLAKGTNTISNKPWSVGIDDPTNLEVRGAAAIIFLKDKALASSGNYRKFRVDTVTGKKYVHTIDPKTGFTKNSNVLAANVVADDCATADAYATAFMAMDLDASIKLMAQRKDLDAYIMYLDMEGNPKEFMSTGFEKLLVE